MPLVRPRELILSSLSLCFLFLGCALKGKGTSRKPSFIVLPAYTKVEKGVKYSSFWQTLPVKVSMVRNEWEGLWVLFTPPKEGEYYVKLKGKGLQGEVFRTVYVRSPHPSDSLGKASEFADPLIPLSSSQALSIRGTTPLFVRWRTTPKTSAGEYRYRLILRHKRTKKSYRLPFLITVHPLLIPKRPNLRALYKIDTPELIDTFHPTKTERERLTIRRRYEDLLLQYRMHPGNLDYADRLIAHISKKKVQLNLRQWKNWLKRSLATTSVFPIPLPLEALKGKVVYGSREFRRKVLSILRQTARFLHKHHWLDRGVVFIDGIKGYTPLHISDEPYNSGKEGYDAVRFFGHLIRKAHRRLKFMVATSVYSRPGWGEIDPVVHIYNAYISEIDECRSRVQELLRKGKQVFCVPNSFSDNLDYPGVFHRALGAFCYKHGLSGIEQWDVFAWHHYRGDPKPAPAKGILPRKWGVGAGALLYPGGPFGVDGPISSVRLELNRDALEDYELLIELEKLSKREYVLQIVRHLIPRDYASMDSAPKRYWKFRQFLLKEIHRLRRGKSLPQQAQGSIMDWQGRPLVGQPLWNRHFATETGPGGLFRIYAFQATASSIETGGLIYQKEQGAFSLHLKERPSVLLTSFEKNLEGIEIGWEDEKERERKVLKGAKLVTSPVRHGKRALKIFVPKGYSMGLEFSSFPRDWSRFRFLALDVFNPGDHPIVVHLAVEDSHNKYREVDLDVISPGKRQMALPKVWTTLLFPLEELRPEGVIGFTFRPSIDLSSIRWFSLSVENEKESGPVTLIVDRIRWIQ